MALSKLRRTGPGNSSWTAALSLVFVVLGLVIFSASVLSSDRVEQFANTTDIEPGNDSNKSSNTGSEGTNVERSNNTTEPEQNMSDMYYENLIKANIFLDYRKLDNITTVTREADGNKTLLLSYTTASLNQTGHEEDIDFVTRNLLEAVDKGWTVDSMKANITYRNDTVGNWSVKGEWIEDYRRGDMTADEVSRKAATTLEYEEIK